MPSFKFVRWKVGVTVLRKEKTTVYFPVELCITWMKSCNVVYLHLLVCVLMTWNVFVVNKIKYWLSEGTLLMEGNPSWEVKNPPMLLLWREDLHKCNMLKGLCRSLWWKFCCCIERVNQDSVLRHFWKTFSIDMKCSRTMGDWATQCQFNTW